jgi:hypothetical protein
MKYLDLLDLLLAHPGEITSITFSAKSASELYESAKGMYEYEPELPPHEVGNPRRIGTVSGVKIYRDRSAEDLL